MPCKMVTNNGHWNCCIIILRRKGRKRWYTTETDNMCICSRNREKFREKFPYYHFSFGSRLLYPSQQPRTSNSEYHGILSQIFKYRNLNVKYLHWFFIIFLYLNCLSPPTVSAVTRPSFPIEVRQNTNYSNKEICSSLDIRNTVHSFHQLNDCRVIEGFLQIVLMDRTNEADFVNLTFPKLREITGYLLLYRVNGLKSLATLFPNLSIIRGHDLFINYALAVYEMLHLQELGLHSLTDIPRGYVFITKNPLLCYIDTIDWSRIVAGGKDANYIFDNRQSNACPKCPNFANPQCGYNQSKQSYCWNAQYCQKTCPKCTHNRCTENGECCHDYCLGGCTGLSSGNCFACKKVFLENTNQCVTKCPDNYYMFRERRCITERECHDMPRPKEEMGLHMRQKPYKPFNGTCIIECPVGYQEIPFMDQDQKLYKCENCSGACRKICDAASVDSIQSAQRLKGCVIINGSLEIQIRGGGNIVKELENSLNMIEEITGYLKIVRSLSLVSLNFLRRLKLIRGDSLENGKYVLVVLDNQNLAELWDFSRRDEKYNEFRIGNGKIFFHFNPKLCLDKITSLQKKLGIEKVDDLEVAPNSNGDKVACNVTTLHVSVTRVRHNSCLITWIPYNHYEMRTLLGYVVYVMEAPPNVNVSMNDGRDACGGDGWKPFDVEVPDPTNGSVISRDNISHPVTHLKPYTRYAYYVKTYTIATETNGAQSQIQYFRTDPSTPTPPRRLKITAVSSSELKVEWQPPEEANGKLEKYIIYGEAAKRDSLTNQRNYCSEPPDDKKESYQWKEEKRKFLFSSVEKKPEDCSCQPENLPKIKKNDQEVQALIEFENKLHDNIYVKNSHTTTVTARTKRGLNYLLEDTYSVKNNGYKSIMITSTEHVNTVSGSDNQRKNLNESDKNPKNSQLKFSTSVNYTTLELRITNLRHFTEYSVNIQACREKLSREQPNAPPRCSTEKMETVQTLPLEEADKIDEKSVEVIVENNTTNSVTLKWAEPAKTNGEILTYVIQYRRIEIENQQAQSQCITHADFIKLGRVYTLRSLSPGNYSIQIKATSLAKDIDHFTEIRYFFIREQETSAIRQLMLGALFAVCIIIVVLVILLIAVRYFYPDSWYNRKILFPTVNPEYFKPIEGYDKWEVPRRKIIFDKPLGIGHFGEVYEGRAKGIIQKGITTKVAIKTLNNSRTTHYKNWISFLNEAAVMKQFDTPHVVRLLGVVTRGEPLVIMELMAKGDLRTYLRSCRREPSDDGVKLTYQAPPTLKEILQMAAEIADGMLYLSDKKFVHRDLAARNCMINAVGTVKIGDFGLTRDVYETDYYRKDTKGHLPVRWMAPESLRDGIFTSRSDVWSFGVVLWEMATLASLPYTGLGNSEIMPYVVNGGIMEEPENCPSILTEIMKLCWQYKFSQRPSFSEILEILLPNIKESFRESSYYFTEAAKQLRTSNTETVADDATAYTPLRIMEDFEDFSLDSDDNENNEENEIENVEQIISNDANTSSENASVRSLPTVNGYIRRPVPVVNTKTTSC